MAEYAKASDNLFEKIGGIGSGEGGSDKERGGGDGDSSGTNSERRESWGR